MSEFQRLWPALADALRGTFYKYHYLCSWDYLSFGFRAAARNTFIPCRIVPSSFLSAQVTYIVSHR